MLRIHGGICDPEVVTPSPRMMGTHVIEAPIMRALVGTPAPRIEITHPLVHVCVWVLLILGLRVSTSSKCVRTPDPRTEGTNL